MGCDEGMTRAVRSGAARSGRRRCRRSTAFGRDNLGGNLSTDVGVEAVAGQQGVGAGPTLAGIGDTRQRSLVAFEQPARGMDIRLGGLAFIAGSPFLEKLIDQRAIDALLHELLAQDALTARTRAIARRDPPLGKRPVVEHAELEQSLDGAFDQGRSVTRPRQPAPNLHDGPRPRLEEPRCGGQNDVRVIDGGPPFAPLGKRILARMSCGSCGVIDRFAPTTRPAA